MFKRILKAFGLYAEKEYHHIVADVQKTVADLETLAERQSERAANARDAVAVHTAKQAAAETGHEQALRAAAKFRELVA